MIETQSELLSQRKEVNELVQKIVSRRLGVQLPQARRQLNTLLMSYPKETYNFESYLNYLKLLEYFSNLENINIHLIYFQNSEARFLSEFEKWVQRKNPIKKNAKPIFLLQPNEKSTTKLELCKYYDVSETINPDYKISNTKNLSFQDSIRAIKNAWNIKIRFVRQSTDLPKKFDPAELVLNPSLYKKSQLYYVLIKGLLTREYFSKSEMELSLNNRLKLESLAFTIYNNLERKEGHFLSLEKCFESYKESKRTEDYFVMNVREIFLFVKDQLQIFLPKFEKALESFDPNYEPESFSERKLREVREEKEGLSGGISPSTQRLVETDLDYF